MKRDLPKYMERHGLSYRVRMADGKKINLGRDLNVALTKYFLLTDTEIYVDTSDPSNLLIIWKRHKKGAARRKIEFSITVADISETLEAHHHRCALTSLPFKNAKPEGMRIRPWAPSIDRIDSMKGYISGNIRVVCAFVNIAMNGFGEGFFEQVLEPLIEAKVSARVHEEIHLISNHGKLHGK